MTATVAAGVLALPAGVSGATGSPTNTIYWGENTGGKISAANLDGSGNGSNLSVGGASVSLPNGLAIDSATNTIYWVNAGSSKISEAALAGSGGGNLTITGSATLSTPTSIAIDPAAGKIFWTNDAGGTGGHGAISEANIDGSGSTDMNTGTATVSYPQGIAIDPVHNKIYWTNTGNNSISYANLDDTGSGGNLTVSGAASPISNPVGLAVDPAAGKLYWADAVASGHISSANLNGSNSADIVTTGASTPNVPAGVAIDPSANKIYWADKGSGKISEANLDGTGDGSDLSTTGATISDPYFVAILKAPLAAGVPQITGNTTAGSTLTCSQGVWGQDLLSGYTYQAPHTYSYEWKLNGAVIPGATSSTETAGASGSYSCQVTAANQAGSTSQTSAGLSVTAGTATPPATTQTSPQTQTPPPAQTQTALTLTHVSQAHKRWREGNQKPAMASARSPVGTTFRFALSESAAIRFSFEQRGHGHTLTRGKLSFHAAAGNRTLRFQGRLSGRAKLKAGSYTLVITATAGGKSVSKSLKFTIAKS